MQLETNLTEYFCQIASRDLAFLLFRLPEIFSKLKYDSSANQIAEISHHDNSIAKI